MTTSKKNGHPWLFTTRIVSIATLLAMVFGITAHAAERRTSEEPPPPTSEVATQEVQAPEAPSQSQKTFGYAERMPSFKGGDMVKFRDWVEKQIVYPESAVLGKISGVVVLGFTIERDGSVCDIQVKQSPDACLSDEAVRIVASSPTWKPGKQHGETVRVRYNLPIRFSLPKGK